MRHAIHAPGRRAIAAVALATLVLGATVAASAATAPPPRPDGGVLRVLLCRLFHIGCRPTTSTSTTTTTSATTTVPTSTTTTTSVVADYWGIEGTTNIAYCGGTIPGRCGTPAPHQGFVIYSGSACTRPGTPCEPTSRATRPR
jgi:hypothetical protein